MDGVLLRCRFVRGVQLCRDIGIRIFVVNKSLFSAYPRDLMDHGWGIGMTDVDILLRKRLVNVK